MILYYEWRLIVCSKYHQFFFSPILSAYKWRRSTYSSFFFFCQTLIIIISPSNYCDLWWTSAINLYNLLFKLIFLPILVYKSWRYLAKDSIGSLGLACEGIEKWSISFRGWYLVTISKGLRQTYWQNCYVQTQ